MPYFRIVTFGCKVNQYDSAGMAQELAAQGWREAPSGGVPDLVLVNTCTVTARADQEARQVIRRVNREFPGAPIWVTGCYAQRAPQEIASLPGVRMVLGNQEKSALVAHLDEMPLDGRPLVSVKEMACATAFQSLATERFPGHTRGSLKIQEGCSHACTYCIVPRVRGPARSMRPGRVEQALLGLAQAGFQEVALTGVDLGQYGRDLRPPLTLADLLRRLATVQWPFRLRLSSLEPQGITPSLLNALVAFPDLCPHFHLPLQSGADPVLEAMQRPYGTEAFRAVVWELCRRFPDAALGLDVLVGFPSETSEDFQATCDLVADLPVAYLHVFPFSPRPGTPAADLRPLPEQAVKARARRLRELGKAKKQEFYQSQLGKVVEVLVEGPAKPEGWLTGLSPNYLRVLLPGPMAWHNRRLPVLLREMRGEALAGEALTDSY
jgi:threonylcarbamoyladenosine tRNA methylthiotransferase MtaB